MVTLYPATKNTAVSTLGSRGTGSIPSGVRQHRLTWEAWAQVARKVSPRRWHFTGLGRISQILPGREKRKQKSRGSKLIGGLPWWRSG